jgi:hypothetical protein
LRQKKCSTTPLDTACPKEPGWRVNGVAVESQRKKRMTDLELELRILKRYAEHHDAVGTNIPKCEQELDMGEVISSITGQPVKDVVVQRWHSLLAPPPPNLAGALKPCRDSTVNRSSHRFYARAYMKPGKAPAWERIAELEIKLPSQPSSHSDAANLVVHKFVSEARIAELQSLSHANFDLRKLIRLCEEINITYTGGALLATAMLTRAILDHVPPIFDMRTFSQVTSNYAGSRSFKKTMERLEQAARNIADGYLHGTIRKREALPEPQQVNFSAEIDALLAEIVRILS